MPALPLLNKKTEPSTVLTYSAGLPFALRLPVWLVIRCNASCGDIFAISFFIIGGIWAKVSKQKKKGSRCSLTLT